MQSLHSSPARPMGPRIQRPASPAGSFALPQIAPLNIRKRDPLPPPPTQNGTSGSPPTSLFGPSGLRQPRPHAQIPSISLQIPTPSPGPGRPKLKLPKMNLTEAFAGGYAGGPNTQNGSASPHINSANNNTDNTGDNTIMPQQATISPTPRPAVVSMDNIRRTVEEFDQWTEDSLTRLDRLGEGASGAVYKVRDKRTGIIMARKSITTLEAPLKQLLREIKIISSTKHDNIIHFYGAYISPSSSEVNVLMDFCEGGSLESVGKQMRQIGGRVSEKVAGRIAEGILQGLNYLHSMKTIHRDIKPPNILLTREGVVKLCDFGVSGELVHSVAGTFTGTSLYMAPERLSGLNYSIRSDVWSTGISLLELVQNRFPFPTDLADIELMMYITQNEPPELEDDEDCEYSAEMKDFMKAALTRNPALRPTPKELLDYAWIKSVMQQDVNMAYWIRKVWRWPKNSNSSRRSDGTVSRSSSSRSELTSLETSMSGLRMSSDSPPLA